MGSSPISSTKKNVCIDCGKEISKKATRCKSCAISFRQDSRAPSREKLKELIRSKSFVQIGKDFGVTDNAVRKWCKYYGLPFRVIDIKSISDEDWLKI